VGGFLATNWNPDLPDIQLYPMATGYQDNALRPVPMGGFSVAVPLIAPRSRGRLQLASADPAVKPDTPYLPDVASPDDEVLAGHVRRWTQTIYHPAGTCAMGTGERTVVDPAAASTGHRGTPGHRRLGHALLTAW
jgi:choline dehydrogenase